MAGTSRVNLIFKKASQNTNKWFKNGKNVTCHFDKPPPSPLWHLVTLFLTPPTECSALFEWTFNTFTLLTFFVAFIWCCYWNLNSNNAFRWKENIYECAVKLTEIDQVQIWKVSPFFFKIFTQREKVFKSLFNIFWQPWNKKISHLNWNVAILS